MNRFLVFLVTMVVVLAGSGCDGGVAPAGEGQGIRTVLRAQTHYAPAAGKTGGRLTVVDEVKLLVKTVQFHRVEDEEEMEFKSESFVVRLDLSGQVTTVAVGAVPEGVYRRVTFKIHKPEDDEAVPDPDFRQGSGGNERYSVIVRGRIDGEDFVLRVRESFQQRLELSPPLVVAPGTPEVAVTLFADVDRWFSGRDGRVLDPRDEDDADDIADNIKDSFRAFGDHGEGDALRDDDDEDDDEEGDDDDDGEERELHGTVEEIGGAYLIVSGVRFEVDESTRFDGVDNLEALTVGAAVEVEYVEREDGSLLAREIEVEDHGGDEDD